MNRSTKLICLFCAMGILNSCLEPDVEVSYCINEVDTSSSDEIDQTELDSVYLLFAHNQLDYSDVKFKSITHSSDGNYHVSCELYYNGIKVFLKERTYHFNCNGGYICFTGDSLSGLNIDTSRWTTDLNKMAAMFVHKTSKDSNHSDNLKTYINNCLKAEYGIFYSSSQGTSLTAWQISPSDLDYPTLFINDKTHEVIYYDSGYRKIY